MSFKEEYISDDGMFGIWSAENHDAMDTTKIRQFIEVFMTEVKTEKTDDKDFLSLYSHTFFQLTPSVKATLNWSSNFDEAFYRRVLDLVAITMISKVGLTMDKSWKGNRPYYMPKFVHVIYVLNEYLRRRGEAIVPMDGIPSIDETRELIAKGVWRDFDLEQFATHCEEVQRSDPRSVQDGFH